MADRKISELTNITGANLADDDEFALVDTSADETKAITFGEFKTALDTATGFVRITGDTMTGNLSMGDNVKAIFGAGSDLQIYHDGSRSVIQDNGTGNLRIQANNLELNNADNSENYLFAANNGAVTLYYDNAEKLNTTSTGISVTGNIANASGDLTIDVAGDIILDADDGDIQFKNGGTLFGSINSDASSPQAMRIQAHVSDGDIVFKGSDSGSTITALQLDMSQAGRATFNEGIVLKSSTAGDFGVNINTASGDSMKLQVVDTGSAGAANGVITVTDGDLILSPSANVGIGTTSPSALFQVETADGTAGGAIKYTSSGVASGYMSADAAGLCLATDTAGITFRTGITGNDPTDTGSERMRIDSSGNVIATSGSLNLVGTNTQIFASSNGDDIQFKFSGTKKAQINNGGLISASDGSEVVPGFRFVDDANTGMFRATTDTLGFSTAGSEAMRINSSGHVLIGKTADNNTTAGIALHDNGFMSIARSSNIAMILDRHDSDGEILRFTKSGTTAGVIGTYGGSLYMGEDDTGLAFYQGVNAVVPFHPTAVAENDNFVDLGRPAGRFKDLYLSGSIEIENGTGNVGVGKQALNSNSANENTAVGYQAGYSQTSGGYYNTYMGYASGYSNTGGDFNTYYGYQSGYSNQGGTGNTYIGKQAGYLMSGGNYNTILGGYDGNEGGLDIRTSSNNIVLADGDGNPRVYVNANGSIQCFMNATADPTIRAKNTNGSYGSTGVMSDITRTSSGGNYYHFSGYDRQAGAYKFQVHDDGDVVNTNNSYGAISDVKLKENIVDSGSQWNDIKALTVRKYSMKSDNLDAPNMLGVIAQEVEAAGMSGLVRETIDRDGEGNLLETSTKQVNYSILYMKAVKALQEAMDRIETLEAKVTALENA